MAVKEVLTMSGKWFCFQRPGNILGVTLARRVLVSIVVLMFTSGSALAMDFISGEKVALEANQAIPGDWYAAGNRVTLEGKVSRDAFILAQQADLRGRIGQDLNLLAKVAYINSELLGSARLVCQHVRIASPIPESALILAQHLTLQSSAQVGRDMVAAAYDMTLDGKVNGRIRLAADTVNVNGTLTGDITIRAQQILVGPQARIQGTLRYSSPQPLAISQGAQVPANVQWQKTEPAPKWKMAAVLPALAIGLILLRLLMAATMLIAGIILVAIAPAFSRRLAQGVHDHPWLGLAWGAVTILGAATAVLILLLTLVGIPLALLLMMLCGPAVFLAQLTAGYLVGITIFGAMSRPRPILAFVVGFLIFAALTFIPILGALVKLAGILLGLGAWWLLLSQKPEAAKPAAPSPGN